MLIDVHPGKTFLGNVIGGVSREVQRKKLGDSFEEWTGMCISL